MKYTITAARYINPAGTDALLTTTEAGMVLASASSPVLWAQMLTDFGTPLPMLPPDFAALRATEFATFRANRQDFLNRMTWVAAYFAGLKTVDGDASSANARAVGNALLDMLTDPAIVASADITALKAAMKARYRAITYPVSAGGMALADVVTAYRKVDL